MLVAVALLSVPAFARAQNTGFIAGVIKDSSGGVLPGASVKIVNDAGNISTDLLTRLTARIAASRLPSGRTGSRGHSTVLRPSSGASPSTPVKR